MTLVTILATLFVVYLGVLVLMAWVSVHPLRVPIFFSPGSLGAPQELLELQADDGVKLAAWWCPANDSRGVIVLFHGYMMNRAEPSVLAAWLVRQGWSCLMVDFPGHGKSGSRRCGFGWTERHDVAAVLRHARTLAGETPVVAWGSSMGAAASAFALADNEALADGLILDSAYGSLVSAVQGWWYFLGGRKLQIILGPVMWLGSLLLPFSPHDVDVVDALKRIQTPTLLLHGDADTLATPQQAARNAEVLGDRGEIVWFEGCGHSEGRWVHPQQYEQAMAAFLGKIIKN